MIKEKIKQLDEMTIKKLEALKYIVELLVKTEQDLSSECVSDYYRKKQKVEKAVLKVDIEFLEVYKSLIELTNHSSLGELSASEYPQLKSLKANVEKIRKLEAEIVLREEQLLSKMSPKSKRLDQRSIEAYKKFKK